jgi:hypothetical protein
MADKNETTAQLRLFGRLFTPSWSSVTLSVAVTLLLMGRLALEQVRSGLGPGATVLQTIADSNNTLLASHSFNSTNTAIQNLPVFALWACVGAVVYFLAAESMRHLIEVGHMTRELTYVHTDRLALTREFAERLVVRLVGLTLLFGTFMLILKMSLPYALASSTTLGTSFSASNLLYAVIGFLILVISLHVLVVSLRLMLLRPRLLGSEA